MSAADDYGRVTAAYYDDNYAVVRDPCGDRAFYRELARSAGGPVLELGCGTGRVLLPIAREGIECTGLDPSPAMLDAFRRKEPPPNLRLVSGRMQDFDLRPQRFSLIFSAFRAFQHLYTVEDQLACLAAARRHLAPGGSLAFDVFAPRLDRIALAHEEERVDARFTQGGEEVVRYARVDRDHASQMMEVTFRYERRSPAGVVRTETVVVRMRYFFRYEVEHLLRRAGFEEITIFGAFDRRPYDYVSGEMAVLAR